MRAMIAPLMLALLLAGCTTVRQEFRGSSPEEVWTALLAAAETPAYDELQLSERWTVTENNVWPDPEGGRIEIFRRLDRVVHRPRAEPQRQRRTWKFRIVLKGEETPPAAVFISRGLGIPVQAQLEGERYFEDVKKLLAREQP